MLDSAASACCYSTHQQELHRLCLLFCCAAGGLLKALLDSALPSIMCTFALTLGDERVVHALLLGLITSMCLDL